MTVSNSVELIPVALERRARESDDRPAFTFVDYDIDPDGYFETLTWSEMYERVRVVAAELLRHGGPGDRVAILAPQSMDYVVGFLGALEAGFVAVPLSVPLFGAHDDRAARVLADCEPVAVMTTTTAVDAVLPTVNALSGPRVEVIELDALDYDSPPGDYVVDHVGSRPALLQYTSGSTGTPSGVIVTHENVALNIAQIAADQFTDVGGYPPEDTTLVSWLPFFHDLGLMLGIMAPVGTGRRAVLTSPVSFLQKPSRWIRLLASYPAAHSAAPNFAFELAARRTRDEDLEGLSLAGVHGIMNAAERVQAGTVRRFNERFAPLGLRDGVQLPAYGLAEATLYVSSLAPGTPLPFATFDYDMLAAGHALRVEDEAASEQVGLGHPRSTLFRVVDPETRRECAAGRVGEVWVHGANIAAGYWRDPVRTEEVFGARLVDPEDGIPEGPWMRTGDLGVISEGDLFVVGRIKDLIIIDGRNHYPDDIEATVSAFTGARTAAVAFSGKDTEQLAVIAELRRLPSDPGEAAAFVTDTRTKVANAVARAHNLRAADIVLVPQGAIPITTSGKTRRRESAELHRTGGFARLGGDA
ncbi:AMP-binding protein [Tsukamurella asaccharolytica]|uniref:AMP-binding protein n=1 Tax=Tsukamurella asaccharolytica TaxID=2592067 RepID=A0A5C5RCR7_9ACTN|nr:AMP-binding protein [Tsukamurella asaccharolytica]TWS19921.1 AMP-binding protein [Tsukamurella asaccharolytica]